MDEDLLYSAIMTSNVPRSGIEKNVLVLRSSVNYVDRFNTQIPTVILGSSFYHGSDALYKLLSF